MVLKCPSDHVHAGTKALPWLPTAYWVKPKLRAPDPSQVSAPQPDPPGCFSHPMPLPRLFPLLGIYPSESSSDVTASPKPSRFLPSHQQLNTPCSLPLVLLNPNHGLREANVDILSYYCFNTWTAISMPLINFKLGITCYFSTIQVSCYSLKAYN